ncbi:MAG: hypothetical protein GY953_01835 [bacterium]|nr:hypothetical protein [bacterium]
MSTDSGSSGTAGRVGKPLPPDPVVEVYKQDIDRSLLRENLKLTAEQRLRKLQRLQRAADELRQAGRDLSG